MPIISRFQNQRKAMTEEIPCKIFIVPVDLRETIDDYADKPPIPKALDSTSRDSASQDSTEDTP